MVIEPLTAMYFANACGARTIQLPAFAQIGESGHFAHAVDMAADQMAAQPVGQAQRLFQIDRRT